MSLLEQLGARFAALDAAALGDAERRALDAHLLDTVGAAAIGARTPDGMALARLPLDSLARAVATTRLTEIDDIHLISTTTPGSIVVPTALVFAARTGISDAAAAASAVAAGYEAMIRLGAAIGGPAILYRGVWPTYFAAPFAAAAVAARLLTLDAETTAHALAIALSLSAGRAGATAPGRTARWLLAGEAARLGAGAAEAAAQGFRGDLALADGPWFDTAQGIALDRDMLIRPQGDIFQALSFKPYCSAKQALAAIAALEEIMARGVTAEAIETVRVCVPPAYARMIDHGAEDRLAAISSGPYQLALAALKPDGLFDVARGDLAPDAEIEGFMAKVSITADETLGAHYPARWPARVEVAAGGRTESATVVDAPGDPGTDFHVGAITQKFIDCADRLMPTDEVDAWIERASLPFSSDAKFRILRDAFGALFSSRV